MGWAPAKNGLHILEPEVIDDYKKIVDQRKNGLRPSFKAENYPIDEEYAEKIHGYVGHLVESCNSSNIDYALGYLYRLLEDRHDKRSIMYLFEAYKNSLPYIDKAAYYNENYELQLLDEFIRHGGGFSTEMESVKNTRFKKNLFSNKWSKRK